MTVAPLAVWCPAYPLPPERQVTTHAACEAFAAQLGWTWTNYVTMTDWQGPGAWASAAIRQTTFTEVLRHPVIMAARGGYGCLDVLPVLAATTTPLPRLIGYSDLTVLHAAWVVRGGPESYYGFMPGVPHGSRVRDTTAALVRGESLCCDTAHYPAAHAVHAGVAHGRIFAGCLRVLAGLVGTPWMPSLRGWILALEDIDERPYRIDRDLQQLYLAGCLDGVVGLITNAFPCPIPANDAGPTAAAIITQWAEQLQIPTVFGLPFGHHADPVALPCGRMATLHVGLQDWALTIAARSDDERHVQGPSTPNPGELTLARREKS